MHGPLYIFLPGTGTGTAREGKWGDGRGRDSYVLLTTTMSCQLAAAAAVMQMLTQRHRQSNCKWGNTLLGFLSHCIVKDKAEIRELARELAIGEASHGSKQADKAELCTHFHGVGCLNTRAPPWV